MLNWKGFVALTGGFQLESENQLEFNVVNNITNNRDLAGQILPWFTSLLDPITIRLNVMAAIDGQVGFGPVIATWLTNSVCAAESPTAVSQIWLWLCWAEYSKKCEKCYFHDLHSTRILMLGLGEEEVAVGRARCLLLVRGPWLSLRNWGILSTCLQFLVLGLSLLASLPAKDRVV